MLPDQVPACEKGRGLKVEDILEAARSVRDSLDVPLLGVAFGPSKVEEASNSMTRQVSFRKSTRRNVYLPLLLR